jgi:predicted RNA-binding protein YlqC (UPF0109 family)
VGEDHDDRLQGQERRQQQMTTTTTTTTMHGGMPLGHAVMRHVRVRDSSIGLIIGRGGSTIRSLQCKSRARIQIDHTRADSRDDATVDRHRVITITGTDEAVRCAEDMILHLSTNTPPCDGGDTRYHHDGRGGGGGSEVTSTPDGSVVSVVPPTPVSVVATDDDGINYESWSVDGSGGIAGRGNEAPYCIGRYDERGESQQAAAPYAHPPPPTQRQRQEEQRQHAALAMATESSMWNATDPRYHPHRSFFPVPTVRPAIETDTISCDRSHLGHIIGKRGSTIAQLQLQSSCNIQIDQANCIVYVTGPRHGIELTRRMVDDIVKKGAHYHPPYDEGGYQLQRREMSPRDDDRALSGDASEWVPPHQLPYSSHPSPMYHYNPCVSLAPPSWQHPRQGYYFYMHPQSTMYQQDHQQLSSFPPPPNTKIAPQGDAALPSWMMATTEDGRLYYYNVNTMETRWVPPANMS